jgi:hypothetical protein
VSLSAWIKKVIGLSKAPASAQAAAPAPSAQASPLPRIDGAAAPVESKRPSDGPPPCVEPDANADAITVEPVQPIDIKTEVEIEAESAGPPRPDIEPELAPVIEVDPESPPTAEEIDRRRAMVRGFFNDYWSSIEDKPASFAERLDHAESYINERVAAGGEAWRLGPATRKQLGLPPSKNR